MRVLFIGWILLLAAVIAPAGESSLSESERADLFSQAKQLFRQANDASKKEPEMARELYQKSALRFERIAREGSIRNGQLFYNTGNAYFRINDIGRAILNYRKAALYTPNDINLQQNLDFARKKRKDAIEERSEAKALQIVFFWHYDFSMRLRAWVFGASFAAAWLLAACTLLVPKGYLKWLAAGAGMVAVLCLGSLIVEAANSGRDQPGVIVAESIVARKGDSESYEQSFREPLHAGTEFQVVEDRGDWFNVSLADGRECWIPRSGVGLVKERP
jgi:tetratricopeptide (TPR) repeat protein